MIIKIHSGTLSKPYGVMMNSGNSAICLQRKYTSVRYIPLKCSRRKIGSSIQKTLTTANMLEKDILVSNKNRAPLMFIMPPWLFS